MTCAAAGGTVPGRMPDALAVTDLGTLIDDATARCRRRWDATVVEATLVATPVVRARALQVTMRVPAPRHGGVIVRHAHRLPAVAALVADWPEAQRTVCVAWWQGFAPGMDRKIARARRAL